MVIGPAFRRDPLLNHFLKHRMALWLIAASAVLAGAAQAETLYFMGLTGDDWQLYAKSRDQPPKLIDGLQNARDFAVNPATGAIVYAAPDGALAILDPVSQQSTALDLGDRGDRFTQLRIDDSGSLWAVQLPAGRSRQTYIVSVNLADRSVRRQVARRGSNFDPFFAKPFLYYSSAHCIDDCDPMIWEIWQRDLRTGRQRQLTLGEAVSRGPVIAGDALYYTANTGGFYHIWRTEPTPAAPAQQLTQGEVADSDLALASDGQLFFIRRRPSGVSIMRLDANAGPVAVALPESITDVRNLEAQ